MASTNEKIFDRMMLHRATIAGIENSIFREVKKGLTAARKEVIDLIATAVQEPLNKAQVDGLAAQVRARLDLAKGGVTAALHDRLLQAVELETKATVSILKTSLPKVVADLVETPDIKGDIAEQIISLPVAGITFERGVSNVFDRLATKIEAIIKKAYSDTFREILSTGDALTIGTSAAVDASKKLSASIGAIRKVF